MAARTTLRKARASKRNVANAISASIRGKLPYIEWEKSCCDGPSPPVPSTPSDRLAASLTAVIVAEPLAELGSREGTTSMTVVPALCHCGPEGETALYTPGSRPSARRAVFASRWSTRTSMGATTPVGTPALDRPASAEWAEPDWPEQKSAVRRY